MGVGSTGSPCLLTKNFASHSNYSFKIIPIVKTYKFYQLNIIRCGTLIAFALQRVNVHSSVEINVLTISTYSGHARCSIADRQTVINYKARFTTST